MKKVLQYQQGFGNHFQSEAIPHTLPQGQNSPQHVAHGLYTEQLSGTAFTRPRKENYRSWLYRIRPSVLHSDYQPYEKDTLLKSSQSNKISPQQMRWSPIDVPQTKTDFIDGLITMADNGNHAHHLGGAIHHYAINASMERRYFYNADGEMLILPQLGKLNCKTEFGILEVVPGEMLVIPRGIKFQILCNEKKARGYMAENFGTPFQLPELGVIGANGLANARDFQYPVATFEENIGDCELICKFDGHLWTTQLNHSPLNVVAWHGNYLPYKYDLRLFNTINSVSYDHIDPSIFTVLTSPSTIAGIANIDFVIFPNRWIVSEHTFRPPYYHRNIMNEYMGLIYGNYDAKSDGFLPGGSSLHNCMSAHGPDAKSYEHAIKAELKPEYCEDTLAFMLESCYPWRTAEFALTTDYRQSDYLKCWEGLKSRFTIPL